MRQATAVRLHMAPPGRLAIGGVPARCCHRSVQRLASQEVERQGTRLRTDEGLRGGLSSASRDADVCANADTCDITRAPTPQRTFGSGGHHGLGATPAGTEGPEVFRALAEQCDILQAETEALDCRPRTTFRSLTALPPMWN